jgi:hypothetical protein
VARTEARISVEIWNDADFRALSRDAQRMFMFLISQADVHHTGLIALRIRRWSQSAADMTVLGVEGDLKELEAARFVVIDWDAEELLIRSFIRRDKVYRQPQVLSVAAEQLTLVTSLVARVALRVELVRIADLEMHANSAALIAKMIDDLADAVEPPKLDTPQISPGGEGGHHPADETADQGGGVALGDWGVVTDLVTDSPKPQAPVPSPQPSLGQVVDVESKPARADPKAFDQFWEIYPRREAKGAAKAAWAKAIKKAAIAAILDGARAYRDDGARQRSEAKFTKLPATWLNAECWTDERPVSNGRASPRDQLTEVNGMRLKPANVEAIARQQRMQALQAQRDQQTLEGTGTWTSPKQIAS